MKSISVIDLVTLPQVPGRVIMVLSTREAGAAFVDLICADPQWLDAEFDALISASFSEPPAPPPPAPPRVPPRPGIPCPPSRRPSPGPAAVTSPAIRPAHGRQRSPPVHRPPGRCPPGT
jgi:hypothetical protein